MSFRPRRYPRMATLAAGLAVLATAAAVPAAAQEPRIDLPTVDSVVVVQYDMVHHMLADRDTEPLLRIYADGRVRVHYPVYMSKAGDYETRLSAGELVDLLASLAADGVLDFDAAAVRADRERAEEAERRAGNLYHVSDVSETIIEVRVASYRPAGAAAPIANFATSLRWPNLHTDARRFTGVAAVQGLARAEQRLRSIMERPDLARVR